MNSITTRLLIILALIGVTPYLLIMVYFSYWENNKIIENTKNDFFLKAQHSKKMIEDSIISLDEEITFLSKLEILDDMISNDIDKQISKMLEQKSFRASKKYMELFAIDLHRKVVATSDASQLTTIFPLENDVMNEGDFVKDDTVYIIKKIHSSFDDRLLGFLVAKFKLKKLNTYLLSDNSDIFEIQKVDTNFSIEHEDQNFLYGSLKLSNLLHGYEIRYVIDKKQVLKNNYNFLFYLLIVTLIGTILIILISRKIAKSITKPIYRLEETSRKIVSTKDFHLRIESSNIVEFNALTTSFNILFQTMEHLLETLQYENAQRLKNYIGLSETFNAISQSNSFDETQSLFLQALRKNLDYEIDISDIQKDETVNRIIIHDYLKDENRVLGFLNVQNSSSLNDLEIIFIDSVSLMMKNHLERISLLEKVNSGSNAKSAFISAMSHELRTPLNAIIGYSQYLITYEEMTDEQMDTIAKIETSSYHLLEIINDILDIAKIEAGKIEKRIESMQVFEELQEALDIIEALVEEKLLHLKVDIDDVKTLSLLSDRKIFKQIIINLISNAIKFTNEGEIAIVAKKRAKQLIIEIKDSGVGISSENLEKIFDEFTQLENAKNTQAKGSGLGLALCKHLSHAIGAEIEITSEGIGKGCSAYLRFNL